MNPRNKRKALLLAMLSGVTCSAAAASVITDVTTDFIGSPLTNTANILSIDSLGGGTVSSLIAPIDISISATSPFTYRGSGGSGTPSLFNSLAGFDLSTGVSSDVSISTINVIFEPGTVDRIFLFDISSGTTVESGYTMQAIIGGTAASPVLGGAPFSIPISWGDTGDDLSGVFPAIPFSFTQNVIGFAVDRTDLGVGSLLGVQIIAPIGADPSAIVGATVPEPASSVFLLGATALLACRRRDRQPCYTR